MPESRFARFLQREGIRPAHLARESRYSRQHILRLRNGIAEPTRACIAAMISACARLTGKPVTVDDLFDLSDVQRPAPRSRRER